jgi:hypothetical protein
MRTNISDMALLVASQISNADVSSARLESSKSQQTTLTKRGLISSSGIQMPELSIEIGSNGAERGVDIGFKSHRVDASRWQQSGSS